MGSQKTAIITGGASGMGLEVAKLLSGHGWLVYILDLNTAAGEAVVREHPDLHFLQVNVTSWESLASAFDTVFRAQARLDFVFANAGILQMDNFYVRDSMLPPAKPPQHSIDINLNAVINTTHLARHYFLASEHKGQDPVLVMTASIASFVSKLLRTASIPPRDLRLSVRPDENAVRPRIQPDLHGVQGRRPRFHALHRTPVP